MMKMNKICIISLHPRISFTFAKRGKWYIGQLNGRPNVLCQAKTLKELKLDILDCFFSLLNYELKRKKSKKMVVKEKIQLGYIIQKDNNRYFGINLTLNLFVYGKSFKETSNKLQKLTHWYINDAIKHNEIKEMIPRRAPFKFYLKYFLLNLIKRR